MQACKKFPLCPDNYDTYCCVTMVPYTNNCRQRSCFSDMGWVCAAGPGKVDSIRTCLEDVPGNKNAFCRRPGEE